MQIARKATRPIKLKFDRRVQKKKERRLQRGLPVKKYYTIDVVQDGRGGTRKTFSGGIDLQSTAQYPQRFCSALFKAWCAAQVA